MQQQTVAEEIQSCAYGQIITVCNSERIIKIGQYLRKLCSNEKGPVFLTHSVLYIAEVVAVCMNVRTIFDISVQLTRSPSI